MILILLFFSPMQFHLTLFMAPCNQAFITFHFIDLFMNETLYPQHYLTGKAAEMINPLSALLAGETSPAVEHCTVSWGGWLPGAVSGERSRRLVVVLRSFLNPHPLLRF